MERLPYDIRVLIKQYYDRLVIRDYIVWIESRYNICQHDWSRLCIRLDGGAYHTIRQDVLVKGLERYFGRMAFQFFPNEHLLVFTKRLVSKSD